VRHLSSGEPLPERYYRAKIDTTPDALLTTHGIKHLHLGGKNSNVILYLLEYSDRISLLQISTHAHLESRPPGKNLLALFGVQLRKLEAKIAGKVAGRGSGAGQERK
jgi:hypothetical protein